jgi:hypothetical protein
MADEALGLQLLRRLPEPGPGPPGPPSRGAGGARPAADRTTHGPPAIAPRRPARRSPSGAPTCRRRATSRRPRRPRPTPRSSTSASWSPRSRPSGPSTKPSWTRCSGSRPRSARCSSLARPRLPPLPPGGARRAGRSSRPRPRPPAHPRPLRRRRRSPSRPGAQAGPGPQADQRAARVGAGGRRSADDEQRGQRPAAVDRRPAQLPTPRATRWSRRTAGGSTPSSASASCTRASTSGPRPTRPSTPPAAGTIVWAGPRNGLRQRRRHRPRVGGGDALRAPVVDRGLGRAVGRAGRRDRLRRPDGLAAGPHLHFEVRVGGRPTTRWPTSGRASAGEPSPKARPGRAGTVRRGPGTVPRHGVQPRSPSTWPTASRPSPSIAPTGSTRSRTR